ncbi:MAG: hypothetical protein F6K41_23300, partial [Symploca sp. SIO3E6]|nr:hypothetical protein [Caldora sp. SIO3E6]
MFLSRETRGRGDAGTRRWKSRGRWITTIFQQSLVISIYRVLESAQTPYMGVDKIH